MKHGDIVFVFCNPDYPWVGRLIDDSYEDTYTVRDDVMPDLDDPSFQGIGQNYYPREDVLSFEEGLERLKAYKELYDKVKDGVPQKKEQDS